MKQKDHIKYGLLANARVVYLIDR